MNIFTIIVFLVYSVSVFCNINQSKALSSASIFGVRWFLAQKFRFQQPITYQPKHQGLNNHLMLFFNSRQPWSNYSFSVTIDSKRHNCFSVKIDIEITANHHVDFNQYASKIGQNHTTYIFKCPILFINDHFLQKTSIIPYTIYGSSDQQDILLFQSMLRSPIYQSNTLSIATIGDWGLLTNFSKQFSLSNPITDCLNKQINNKDLRLILLLGDLAYDLQGQSYISFFNYLQPFSQQIPILFTPGNHETIKHKDIFELIKQSFYSPFWNDFYGYFDLVQIREYVFLGYNTEQLFPFVARDSNSSLFKIELSQYGNYSHLFQLQLHLQSRQRLRNHKVFGYSHYPIFCSEQDNHQSCKNYHDKHLPFLQKLQDIQMGLFFSGHLHFYERSKQICSTDGSIVNNNIKQFYAKRNCSIFVLQGCGGNNYYVQSYQHSLSQSYSQKILDNTGFGVLTLDQSQEYAYFKHILASSNCKIGDEFILNFKNQNDQKYFFLDLMWIKLALVIIIFILIIRIISVIYRRKFQKNKKFQTASIQSYTNTIELAQTEHYK